VLLDIFERAEAGETEVFIEALSSLKSNSTRYAALFSGEEPAFIASVERAMDERVTELVYAARDLVFNGTLCSTEFGRSIEVDSLKELTIDYINVLSENIGRMATLMQEGVATRASKGRGFDQTRFSDDMGDMLLQIRSEGSYGYDPQLEYGTTSGVEASISIKINPYGGHISAHKHGTVQELSIRLDREGRDPSQLFTATKDRDPTQDIGTVSLDIGSVLGNVDSFGTRIALILSRGNRLRAEALGTDVALNHNASTFDQPTFGTSIGFKGVAERMQRLARVRTLQRPAGTRALSRASSI